MVNAWTFSGRLGANAELNTTQGGTKVCKFRVCNTIGFGDRKHDQWVECSYWGKAGESVAQYLTKGGFVTVSGELKLENFDRRDGTPGSKLTVRVHDLDLPKREGGAEGKQSESGYGGGGYGGGTPNAGYGGGSGGATNKPKPKPSPEFDDDLDDTIPF